MPTQEASRGQPSLWAAARFYVGASVELMKGRKDNFY